MEMNKNDKNSLFRAKNMLFLAIFYSVSAYSQKCNQDSLRILLQSIENGESYEVYYADSLIGKFSCETNKPRYDFFCAFHLTIPVDSTMKDGEFLDLEIYRKSKYGHIYRNTNIVIVYNSHEKYLRIYRDHRVKNRYALSYMWRDEKGSSR